MTPRTLYALRLMVADAALDAIARACGCAEWEYPTQVVRDVLTVVARADALRAIVEVEHAVAAERARCAAVCRAVAAAMADDTALACAEAIERGPTGGGL